MTQERPQELPEPHLRVGALCEKVIEDKENILSLICLIDRLVLTAQGIGVPEEMPPTVARLSAVMSWVGGLGNHEAKVRIHGGPEDTTIAETPTLPFLLDALDRVHNIIVNLTLELKQQGLYWVEFLLNGKVKSRIPLRIVYHRIEMPTPRTRPSPQV